MRWTKWEHGSWGNVLTLLLGNSAWHNWHLARLHALDARSDGQKRDQPDASDAVALPLSSRSQLLTTGSGPACVRACEGGVVMSWDLCTVMHGGFAKTYPGLLLSSAWLACQLVHAHCVHDLFIICFPFLQERGKCQESKIMHCSSGHIFPRSEKGLITYRWSSFYFDPPPRVLYSRSESNIFLETYVHISPMNAVLSQPVQPTRTI
jgi:hypothetical protein